MIRLEDARSLTYIKPTLINESRWNHESRDTSLSRPTKTLMLARIAMTVSITAYSTNSMDHRTDMTSSSERHVNMTFPNHLRQ